MVPSGGKFDGLTLAVQENAGLPPLCLVQEDVLKHLWVSGEGGGCGEDLCGGVEFKAEG